MTSSKKPPFWWKEYIEKDNNIIRPFDGYEYPLTFSYLSATDIYPFSFTLDEFISKAEQNLPNNDIFNYKVKYIENYPFWYKQKIQLIKGINVIEKENPNMTYEDYIKSAKKTFFFQNYNDSNDPSIKQTFKFEITHLKNNTTMFTLYTMHCMCDGRTLFNILDYLSQIIELIKNKSDQKLPIKHCQICPFGQFDNYKNLSENIYKEPPKRWLEIPKMEILPKISEKNNKIEKEKNYYVISHEIYDYQPIKRYCKDNNVSIQAMLTTMIARSTRKFYNLKNDTPIYNYTPCDSRQSPYANDDFKKREYFCGAGALFPCSIGQGDLLSDIKYNYKALKESIPELGNISQILRSSMTINKDTLEFVPEDKMPSFSKQACTIASHIGAVKGNKPFFSIWMDMGENVDDYVLAFHACHNDDFLIIPILRPNLFNPEFLDIIKKEMDLIFNIQ